MYQYSSKGKAESEQSKENTPTTIKNHMQAGIKIPMQTKSLFNPSFNQENDGEKLISNNVVHPAQLIPFSYSPLQMQLIPKQEQREIQPFPLTMNESQERLAPISAKANNTGIPTPVKKRFEALSGFSFDDVKAHYNSDKPAQLQALAYTQGNQVHIGPGQEKHLEHELGHVVQQKQGRVKPTGTVGGVAVNDAPELEREADHADRIPFQFKGENSASILMQKMDASGELVDTKDAMIGRSILEGQDKKTFLLTLRDVITNVADELLAQINQTSDECPYISKWFGYYEQQDKAYLERAIARFAPETDFATNVDEYIHAIANRARVGLQNHIKTGSIEDVPNELVEEQHEPEDFLHIAQTLQPVTQFSLMCCGVGKRGRLLTQDESETGREQSSEKPYLSQSDTIVDDKHSSSFSSYSSVSFPQDKPESEKKIEKVYLSQGVGAVVEYGTFVVNSLTISCGLMLGFGEKAVVCYHLPFMDKRLVPEFAQYINEKVGQLKFIVIVANSCHTGDKENVQKECIDAVNEARKIYNVLTTYYEIDTASPVDPQGTVNLDGFKCINHLIPVATLGSQ